jgi:SAM-dependent methyltransferase
VTTVDYDELWGHAWGELQDIGPVHRHAARTIVDLIRPLGLRTVLDVGCGNGVNLAAIQHELPELELSGLDLSATAIALARRRVRGRFSVVDLVHDERPPGSFDLVLSAQVIEHVDDDAEFLAGLRALAQRYVIVATMQGRMRRSEAQIGHLRNYTRASLERMMCDVGLEPVRTVEWGFPFFSPLYRSGIELVGGGHSVAAGQSRTRRLLASSLYHIYRLNSSHRGDVLTVLARVR